MSIEPLEPKHIRMFHDMALKTFGGLSGEHEPNLIDSLGYKPGLLKKAAVYMHTLTTISILWMGTSGQHILLRHLFWSFKWICLRCG